MWGEFTSGIRIFNPPSPVLKAGAPFVPFLRYTALYMLFVLGFSYVVDVHIFFVFLFVYVSFYIFVLYLCYICIFSFATSARYLPPTCYHHLYILSHVE